MSFNFIIIIFSFSLSPFLSFTFPPFCLSFLPPFLLSLPPLSPPFHDTYSFLGLRNITQVHLEGIDKALGENPEGTPNGIKVHFKMDDSGLLVLDSVSIY